MKVAVIGATGVLGIHLIPRLGERGHEVYACSPSLEKLQQFAPLNVQLKVSDILKRDSLVSAISGCDTVVHIATAIPPPGPKRDWSLNDRIRKEGTSNLISACEQVGIKFYVQQSIAHLVNSPEDRWLTEDDQLKTSTVTQSAAEMENQVKNSKLNWQIIRGGSLYGPGTKREEYWSHLALQDKLFIPKMDGYISLIHVSDLAAAYVDAIEKSIPELLINIVDDEPVKYSILYSYIATALNTHLKNQSKSELQELPSFRASNKRAKEALLWKPHYSSYRAGLAARLRYW